MSFFQAIRLCGKFISKLFYYLPTLRLFFARIFEEIIGNFVQFPIHFLQVYRCQE